MTSPPPPTCFRVPAATRKGPGSRILDVCVGQSIFSDPDLGRWIHCLFFFQLRVRILRRGGDAWEMDGFDFHFTLQLYSNRAPARTDFEVNMQVKAACAGHDLSSRPIYLGHAHALEGRQWAPGITEH